MKLKETRFAIGLILLTAACAASAQVPSTPAGNYHHPARPYGVAGVLFFTVMTSGTDDSVAAGINKVRNIAGVDAATARDFLAYASSALQTLEVEAPQRNQQFCAQRAELNTIPKLATAMYEADAALEQRRAQLVRGAESVLGREGMLNLEGYLSTKDVQAQRIDENYEARLQRRSQSPEHVLALICDKR